MTRKPAVAGAFYEGSAGALKEHVRSLMPKGAERRPVKAAMSPHAGLMYSGGVAAEVYAAMEPPATFVLLGPNHTGIGKPVAMMSEGSWQIPTATFEIDSELARAIASRTSIVTEDSAAHEMEHSLEVQLPFIAEVAPGAKIVPIAIMHAPVEDLMELGRAVADAVAEAPYPVVIVASSDMSHFIPDEEAREIDGMALERVLDLDPEDLYRVVLDNNISMCGVMPAVVMLSAAVRLGATQGELAKYATSGDVSGDYSSVVGYAGVLIS